MPLGQMCKHNCYYGEDRRLGSCFGWLRATQHCAQSRRHGGALVGLAPQIETWNTMYQWSFCQIMECQVPPRKRKAPLSGGGSDCACHKWLPTCRWLQFSVNLQSYNHLLSRNWTESYRNLQSHDWTKSCKEVRKEIIIPIQMCLSKSDNIQIDQYIQMSQDLNPSACSCLFIFIYSPYENHTQCNAIWEVATASPRFCNEPHPSHDLFVNVPGTTFTSWSKRQFVVIRQAEQQVRRASHCGTKQQ